jgi:L,D-transpeptidase YbiS
LGNDPVLQELLRETEENGAIYLLIDVAASRLNVMRGTTNLRECVISAGSGQVLRRGNRAWRFETPRGMFTVLARQRNPVWVMPDWAFAEAGQSAPPLNSPRRRVRGVLGRYALDLGGGYKIHGTPLVNQLGRNVTHGCIRVGASDLQFIWDNAPIGTRVFIR